MLLPKTLILLAILSLLSFEHADAPVKASISPGFFSKENAKSRISFWCKIYDQDDKVLKSVIYHESGYVRRKIERNANGETISYGLGQNCLDTLYWIYWRENKPKPTQDEARLILLENWDENIRLTVKVIKTYREIFPRHKGSYLVALSCHNAGADQFWRWVRNGESCIGYRKGVPYYRRYIDRIERDGNIKIEY